MNKYIDNVFYLSNDSKIHNKTPNLHHHSQKYPLFDRNHQSTDYARSCQMSKL